MHQMEIAAISQFSINRLPGLIIIHSDTKIHRDLSLSLLEHAYIEVYIEFLDLYDPSMPVTIDLCF